MNNIKNISGYRGNINQNRINEALKYQSRTQSFEGIIKEKLSESKELQISKHAKDRIEQRGITVSNALMEDLAEAVEKASQKGSKDVVIIGKEGAFIVNVQNKVIVTSMSVEEMKNNIFTNIDSAVIL